MNGLNQFARDRRGNVAITFAIAAIPVLILTGAGVDFTQATRVRMDLQSATDSAALALARDGLTVPQSDLTKTAKAYVAANYDSGFPVSVTKVTLDKSTVTAEINSSADVPTTFLALTGMKSLPVSVKAVAKGMSVEIAMVLDTSYSMHEAAGTTTKIAALKEASTALLDTMFGADALSQRFTISVVPFSSSVNVGTGNANAAWLDTTASNNLHREDFDKKVTRFSLFGGTTGMKTVSWGGCVISREAPYDIDDVVPGGGDSKSLFVPWFAPDEPDPTSPLTMYAINDYLDDEGGDCVTALNKTANQLNAESNNKKQARTCKYKAATPSVLAIPELGSKRGPNFLCDAKPITPLTNSRTKLDAAVTAMQPGGTTNILEGLAWGWRTLSPSQPFTEGRAYNSANNHKVIILMTDGENFVGAMPSTYSFNMSAYSAYGYVAQKRLTNPAKGDEASNTVAANAKVLQACTKAKAKNIKIYTIAFGADAAGSQDTLRSCASTATDFYAPQKASELKPVFVKIAEQINQLRIAQ